MPKQIWLIIVSREHAKDEIIWVCESEEQKDEILAYSRLDYKYLVHAQGPFDVGKPTGRV